MMPVGECTITLQDIGVISGLPIDGDAVVGNSIINWMMYCQDTLGLVPPANIMRGSSLPLSWLVENFNELPDDADEEVVQRYARAYILRIIGGSLFTDRNPSRVNLMFLPLIANLHRASMYSWGSACLAWLYRELCRAIDPSVSQLGGALHILQIWAWERFISISPSINIRDPHNDAPLGSRWSNARRITQVVTHVLLEIRYKFDRMGDPEMVWEPYSDELLASLPLYCTQGRDIWRAVVPLICFHVVEWHQPDRVLRQFGMQQSIPHPPR
ncbi:serine/threonine-protein phosphatase 7 long form homolog [Manihot esculenta]|uniref:serine/threonine-protein phosphatase 7 long form homolog n=1 Tax=Manihot esculenta TaxID=3983 RepID=UPI001CC6BEFA|nr:serine/threonine-protein phosphatase 7 long form homolog [Manihot esculenta]